MDGATTISQLVQQVLDLVSEVLVLPLDDVQLLDDLLVGGLQAEQLAAVVPALVLRGINLSHDVAGLGLPLAVDLLEVLASLLSNQGGSVDSLVVHGHLLQLSVEPGPGLLNVGNLGLQRVHGLLSLQEPGLQLGPPSLQLLNATHALCLIAGPPQLDLSSSLGQGLHGVGLPDVLVLDLLPQVGQVGGHGLVLGEEGSLVLGLAVTESLHVLQLSGGGGLGLAGLGTGSLQLLNLPVEVLVLHVEPLLGGLGLIEVTGEIIQPVVGVHNGSVNELGLLVNLGLALDGLLQRGPGVSQVSLQAGLVLLALHLAGVQVVDLLAQLRHAVVVLHTESGQGALVSDVELLQLAPDPGQLGLPLLVELHLGGGVGASLVKPGAHVLDVLLEERSILLSLGSIASLELKLLVQLLHAGNELLDLLGVLGGQGGLVLNLSRQSVVLLLLPGQSLVGLRLDSIQVIDGLLGHLEVS